uniref:TIL domain-containing protein n=1 Tax=Phlebotomus papatasi TaxID=29031 RepID=A0A1B0D8S4_PHLPP
MTCPANEEYSSCGNSCQEDCSTKESDCKKTCESGCFCIAGYKRVGGVCVPKPNCPPPKCPGKYEEYTTCGNTCNEDCTKSYKECLYKGCDSGCFCKANYKRVDGECVPEEYCPPPDCPIHEVYTTCGNSCYDECGTTKEDCRDEKCYAGCYCQKGFKRIDGVCLPESKCEYLTTKCAGPNEVYIKCGKSCNEDCLKSYKDCLYEPYINQDTEAGELRSKPVKNKPPYYESAYEIIPKCPKNEEYLSCGPDCEDECSRRCSPQNTGCKKGCFCKNGYVRHGGRCISLASCQKKITCPRYEEWKECSSAPYCDTCGGKCDYKSQCPGCFCRKGYYRHPTTNQCVNSHQCPPQVHYCSYGEEYNVLHKIPPNLKAPVFFSALFLQFDLRMKSQL